MNAAAAKKRCEAATEGPWAAIPFQELAAAGNFMTEWGIVTRTKMGVMKKIRQEADAEFAAHARTDLPAALEIVQAAQKVWDTVPATFDGSDAEEHSRALVVLGRVLGGS